MKYVCVNCVIGKMVKSVSLWCLYLMVKNEGLGDEGEVLCVVMETASDAERVDGKFCNVGMWVVVKLVKMVLEG